MTVTQRIFAIAKEKNISLTKLSAMTNISISTLSSWKSRNTCPSSDKIYAIAEALDVSVSYLLGVDEAPSENNNIIMNGNSFAAGYIKDSTVNADMFCNPEVTAAYNSLSATEKLEIQIEILKKADKNG